MLVVVRLNSVSDSTSFQNSALRTTPFSFVLHRQLFFHIFSGGVAMWYQQRLIELCRNFTGNVAVSAVTCVKVGPDPYFTDLAHGQ